MSESLVVVSTVNMLIKQYEMTKIKGFTLLLIKPSFLMYAKCAIWFPVTMQYEILLDSIFKKLLGRYGTYKVI